MWGNAREVTIRLKITSCSGVTCDPSGVMRMLRGTPSPLNIPTSAPSFRLVKRLS